MSRRGLLAGFSAVLTLVAACSDQGVAPTTRAMAAADSADQILWQMTTTVVREGVRQSLIQADTAFIYQERQVASLRELRATFFDPQGNPSALLTSKWGEYHIQRGALDARDSVVVVMLDGTNRRLETEHLVYDRDRNEVRSDSAFVYTTPDGMLRGTSFTADPGFKRVVTREPRGRQRGQGIVLPGQ